MLDRRAAGEQAESGVAVETATSLAVLIVGMHRSGTSAISGVLSLLGVATPEDLHPADEHNRRGYFEPQRIIDFHEALFAKLGSPSNDPLPVAYDWLSSPVGRAAVEELADLLDEEFGGRPMCLFKDPRICRLMPVWTEALARTGRPAVAIIPCRAPLEVAGSLQAKAGLSRAYSLFMWLQHVILGERFTRGMRRSFTSYDGLLADWRAVVAKVERDLGVAWPRDLVRASRDIDEFLSGQLRHHQADPENRQPQDPLHGLCLRAWAALGRLQDDPTDPAAQAELDQIAVEFETVVGVAGPLIASYQADVSQLRTELARRQDALEEAVALRIQEVEGIWKELKESLRAQEVLRVRFDEAAREVVKVHDALRERERQLGTAHARLEALSQTAHEALSRLAAIENSTTWRAAHVLRKTLGGSPMLRRLLRRGAKLVWWTATGQVGRRVAERRRLQEGALAGPASQDVAPSVLSPPTPTTPGLRIAFLSGEPDTPGHLYRVLRYAEAAEMLGATTTVLRVDEAQGLLSAFREADFVILWRAAWDANVEAAVTAARAGGAVIVFDVDDLIVEPRLAKPEIIDGLRSQRFDAAMVVDHFERLQRTLRAADFATAPTPYLAQFLEPYSDGPHWKLTFQLPNGFDEDVLRRSRLAARRRRLQPDDGLIRIGYATGSKTHQADFRQASAGIARVLRDHPEARLVLFKGQWGPVLDIAEFHEFDGLVDQIEWREFVPPRELPNEIARFDVNVAPLELGNIFCEAKSELKYFEAALVDTPTVASPTEPFRIAIRDGETGFVAANEEEWYAAVKRLVADPDLRRSIARAALADALVRYGPERRAQHLFAALEQMRGPNFRAARAFAADPSPAIREPMRTVDVPPHSVVFESDLLGASDVTVVIPLYNYARYIEEALESVAAQGLKDLDIVVVDDVSTDDSMEVAHRWLLANAGRFNRALLIRNDANSGLARTRNVGFAAAETAYVLPLDADNRLLPACAERLLAELRRSGAAFAYPQIRQFGDTGLSARGGAVLGAWPYAPVRLRGANYIDAMAMVRKAAWLQVGGYDHIQFGWEDYDFWCKLAETGAYGEPVSEVLAEYRVHASSMLRSETDEKGNKRSLIESMERRHPWLQIDRARPADSESPAG